MLTQEDIVDYYQFPDPKAPNEDGIVCAGGDLSIEMLISAYRQGVFPWFNEEDPVLWWSPQPRCVTRPGEIYVSKNMKRLFNQKKYTFKCDTNFLEVINKCKSTKRNNEDDTWITDDFIKSYYTLHVLGIAHSFEVYNTNGILVGGLYGICIGKMFYGESMFSIESNTSKLAFILLSKFAKHKNLELIDCQVVNPHLTSMGCQEMDRIEFLEINSQMISRPTSIGVWSSEVEKFCENLII